VFRGFSSFALMIILSLILALMVVVVATDVSGDR
jgi:hypothetical protein